MTLPPFTCSVPLLCSLHCLPVNFRVDFKICLLTYMALREKQPIFTPCLPHHSHPGHQDQTKESICWSLGSRPTQAWGLFTLVPLSFGTTSHYLFAQPPQLQSSENVSKCISLAFLPETPAHPMAHWYYGTVLLILLLNTDSTVSPLSLATPGILAL